MDAPFTAFLVFTAILVLTPGATTAVVVRNVFEGGRRAGVAAAAGAAIANSTWAAVAALGLAATLARAPVAYMVLRYAGAAYLAYLGARGVARAWLSDAHPEPPGPVGGGLELPASGDAGGNIATGARQGLLTNLLNPPVATFYLVVVPTFLPADDPLPRRFLIYALIHVSMAFSYHCAWACAVDLLGHVWARPGARRVVETLTGAALLGLAWQIAQS